MMSLRPLLLVLLLGAGFAGARTAARAQEAPEARPPAVLVGLERMDSEGFRPLRNKRVALLTHAAAVDWQGRHVIDLMRRHEVRLVRLFSPEHGLRSDASAGEKVASGEDAGSGLPVVSLYGEKTKPERADFEGVDVLVIDLQDAGVRFYTYASTMLLSLDAAAEAGVEVLLLDRPNPLGGDRVEGPTSGPRNPDVPPSLVNMAPGPLVHGLTLGEMARHVNARRPKKARLDVVEMRGWRRGMMWDDTGRPWVPPSPNLRSVEAAVAYPGTALLEATNVSEGRGTDAPFLLVGAPWLRTGEVMATVRVPGFGLEATKFTPKASRAAARPKHEGVECRGLSVRVKDPRAARPYELGIALLHAIRFQPEFRWRADGALERLLGASRPVQLLRLGYGVDRIVGADADAIAAWRTEREAALIYER